MKKIIFCFIMAMACLGASAVPAIPTPQKVTQPNGEELTVRIKGDEFYHYMSTADGYTIVKNEQGYYTYGTLINDEVVASKIVARDADKRSASDNAWLAATGKNLRSERKVVQGLKARIQRDALPKTINYNSFHGIVILVEFQDSHFTRSDAQEFYSHMINDENYTGYTNEDGSANPYGNCTGSVRDYFHDNSKGIFTPQFDVAGPFEVPYSVNQGDQYSYNIFLSALSKANPTVDFSQYDLDNNGIVDLVYFLYADTPSSSDSSSPNHIWPHRSSMYNYTKYDGKYVRDYACSAEYIYAKSYGIFDGIGTICHEFSHVLGLPDLYDTNEDNNNSTGGESQHPGEWDLMAGGNYQNNARTPVAYSLYDRYSLGFANVQVINAEGDYSLNPICTTGDGYILKTPTNKEIFLIDNRQTSTKWDAYAPGHGMIIARMDSTNASVWNNNGPNANATRLYYEMLRAGGSTAQQSPTDPFPGTRGVAMVTNDTPANLMAWGNKRNQYNLYNIHEEGDVVKFSVKLDNTFVTAVEDFEPMTPKTSNNSTISDEGSLATWTFAKCYPASPTDNTLCNGAKAVAMKKPSTATMTTDVAYDTYLVTFDFYNPTNINVSLQLYMSTDKGQTWTVQPNVMGNTTVVAGLNSKTTLYYPINVQVPARYRVACTAGSTSLAGYVDDFTIYHNGELSPVVVVPGDVDGDGVVTAGDITILYNFLLNNDDSGMVNGDVDGDGSITSGDVTAIYNILLGN